jgi:hypothetical protein
MSNIAPISGVGKNAKRTDRGMVQKIQRNAKIQNASGGAYGQRAEMQSLASGAPTGPTASAMNAQTAPVNVPPVQSVNAFATGRENMPLSHGAAGGPGGGAELQQTPVDSVNPDSMFIRAMAAANPENRHLLMMVEAYNEMEF